MDQTFQINGDAMSEVDALPIATHAVYIKEEYSSTNFIVDDLDAATYNESLVLLIKSVEFDHDYHIKYSNALSVKREFLHEDLDVKTENLCATEDQIIQEPPQAKTVSCISCNNAHNRSRQLHVHMQRSIYTCEKPYKCYFCNFKSGNKSHLRNHTKTHMIPRLFKCNVCEYTSSKKSDLTYHIITHTSKEPYKCDKCDFSSNWETCWKEHTKIHNKVRLFICRRCKFKTASWILLQHHTRSHVQKKAMKYRCAMKC